MQIATGKHADLTKSICQIFWKAKYSPKHCSYILHLTYIRNCFAGCRNDFQFYVTVADGWMKWSGTAF